MKKWICVLLVLGMLAALTACRKDETGKGDDTSEETNKTVVEEAPNDAAEVKNDEEDTQTSAAPETKDDEGDAQISTASDVTLPEFNENATIDETVLLDQDDLKIIATALEYDSYGVDLKLSLENNSDKTLAVSANTVGFSGNSVNGFMVLDGYFSCDIEPGKKANETATFAYDQLQLFGINEIADIVLGIRVSDEDNKETLYTDCQLKTSIADTYAYDETAYQKTISGVAVQNTFGFTSSYFAAEDLYDADGVQIVSAALLTNRSGKRMVLLEAVNNGTEIKEVAAAGVAVNGLTVYDGSCAAATICSGKRGVIVVNLDDIFAEQYWEAYGLTEISSLDIKVGIQDGWDLNNENIVHLAIGEDEPLNLDGDELFDQDGIRIISKGRLGHENEYDSNMYLALLIENGTDNTFDVGVQYGSLSVNDVMTTEFSSDNSIPPHAYGVLIVKIYGSDLEEAGVTEVEQIQKVECVIEFGEGYDVEIEVPITAEF